jgi:hypothetical protein
MPDYIKATEGFEKLGQALGTPAKSLIRMFGPRTLTAFVHVVQIAVAGFIDRANWPRFLARL